MPKGLLGFQYYINGGGRFVACSLSVCLLTTANSPHLPQLCSATCFNVSKSSPFVVAQSQTRVSHYSVRAGNQLLPPNSSLDHPPPTPSGFSWGPFRSSRLPVALQ